MGRISLAVAALFALLAMPPGHDRPVGPAVADAATASSCEAITPESMASYARVIERALKSAQKDVRANGTSGAYAVAATNSRDLLNRAMDRVNDGAEKLRSADPRTTTYAEGGMIKEHIRSTLEWMPQAGHWALVSAIYHKSTDARDAFEGTISALEEGNRLYAESGRCYLTGYL